jgi:streptogramin lyase
MIKKTGFSVISKLLTASVLVGVFRFASAAEDPTMKGRTAGLPKTIHQTAGLMKSAAAATPPIVGKFPAPSAITRGLVFDGTNLWAADDGNMIYKLDPGTGAVIASYTGPGSFPGGLSWDGAYLWCSDFGTGLIYKLNPSTMAVATSFSAPGSSPYGLACDGSFIYMVNGEQDTILKLDPVTGAEVGAIACNYVSPNVRPFGLVFMPIGPAGQLWTSDGGYGSNMVSQFDCASNTWVDQWAATPASSPCGIASDPLTGRIWVSCWTMDSIYVYQSAPVDTTNIPHITVSPRSFTIGPTSTTVQTLNICNTGMWDTLHYTIYGVAGRVTADTATGWLSAGSCKNVTLTFNRAGLPLGSTIIQLRIGHNAWLDTNPVSVLCTLVVDSSELPRIALTPKSFRLAPTDTNVQTLQICNPSILDTLQYSISARPSTPNILAWTYGADLSYRYPNTVAAILQHLPAANIATTTTSDAAALSTLLQAADVFLIPSQYNYTPSSTIGTAFRPVLDSFVRRGGIVIALHPYRESAFLTAGGLDSITYSSYTYNNSATVNVPADPVFDSIAATIIAMPYYTSYWTGSAAAVQLASISGYAVCTKQTRGSGVIYLLGVDFYSSDAAWARMIANCISKNRSLRVTADTATRRLAAGECRDVQLIFDRNGLLPGQTVFSLIIDHNSPLSPDPLSVPCTLLVDSASVPRIALTPGGFRIGPTDPQVKTLAICNSSTHDPLQFTIDSVAGRRVIANTSSGLIAAGGCRNVTLTFNRAGLPPGTAIVQLIVRHNGPLEPNPLSVPCTLVVDAAEAPHIALTPGGFRIGPTDPAFDTLTICNTSTLNALRYTVAKNGSTPNILSWTYGAEMTYRYPNTAAAIRQLIPSANITTTTTTAAAALSTLLQAADVFLIPAQATSSPSSIIGTAFLPVLDSFVRRGGIVIALQPYWESAFLTASGLDSITYYSYTSNNSATVNAPADPVFDSIAAAVIGMPNYTGYWTGSSSAVRLASYSGYAVCTKQTRGSGVIYLLGADFYSSDAAWTRMLDNCILQNFSTGPITVDTSSGNIAAGGCRNVQFTFNRSGLLPGTNVFKIRVRHDSPLSPDPLSVPCTLYVDSASVPHISLSPGGFRIGPTYPALDTLAICNSSTQDTLQFTIDSVAGRRVVADTSSGRIAAGGCRNVSLTFNRTGLLPGTAIVQLIVRHNDPLEPNPLSIPCTLVVDSASVPHLALTPKSFRLAPTDTNVQTLQICNTGTEDTLEYSIAVRGSTPNILAWTYGADLSYRYPNTVAAILQHLPAANIATTTTSDAAALSTLLQAADVFLIPSQYNYTPSSTIGTAFRPVLDSFVRRGGIVIALHPYRESAFLTAGGLDSITYSSYTYNNSATVNVPADPVFDSIAATIIAMPYYTSYWTGSAAAVQLASISGYAVCTKQTRGSGGIYLLGADFYYTDATWGRMLANCILQNFSTGPITVDTSSGNIAAGGCRNVQLTFNRSGLLPGTNVFQIRVRHDSPFSPDPLSVPCTLYVDSASVPHIALTPGSFRIEPTDTNVQTLQICNTGTEDTLEYSIASRGSTPDILAWIYGADSAGEYVNIAAAIRTRIPAATITTTRTTDPATLAALLVGRSVFLMPEQETTAPSSAIGTAFAPILDAFVRSGGTVIVLSPTYPSGVAGFLSAAGLETLSYSNYTSSGTVTVNNPTHPVFDSVAIASILMENLTGLWTGTSGATVLASYSGYAVCTELLRGSGAIYLLGPDFYTPNTTTWGRMLANGIKRGSSSRYVTADSATASGRLAAGECRDVQLTFDRSGLLPGNTVFELSISHNSPLSPDPLSVPCTLVVDSTTMACSIPSMAVTMYTGDTAMRYVTLQNTGSSELIDSVISFDSIMTGYITATQDSFHIDAGQRSLIPFRYDASSLRTDGFYIDTFQIIQNSKDVPSPIIVICSLTVISNIVVLIPYTPDPTVNRQPTLEWHPVASASMYRVEASLTPTFSTLEITQQTSDTTFSPAAALPLGRLYWRVRCDPGTSYSLPDDFYIQNDSIPLLIPIVPDTIGQQPSTLFRWHPSTGAASYRIVLYDIDSASPATVLMTYVTDTSYLIGMTLPISKYSWTVSANFDYTRTAYPDTFWVSPFTAVIPGRTERLPTAFALKAHASAGNLKILYDIPLQTSGEESRTRSVMIDLYDIRGKLIRVLYNGVLTAGYHRTTVNVGNIASGVYYCRMRAGGHQKIAAVYLMR